MFQKQSFVAITWILAVACGGATESAIQENETDSNSEPDTATDVGDTETETATQTDSAVDTDGRQETDSGTDTGTASGTDTDIITQPDGGTVTDHTWQITRIDTNNTGLWNRLAVGPNDEVNVAYFDEVPFEDGPCTELDHAPYPTRRRFTLKLATRQPNGEWQTEVVDTPLAPDAPPGLAFDFSKAGDPALAYTGGDPKLDWCGGNDAVYATKTAGAWAFQTAAVDSGEAVTGDEAADAGFGVGWYPALAFDPSGEPLIAYQDRHFVYLQRDDHARADLEIAWRQTSGVWRHEAVDFGDGAGDASAVVFDRAGRPIVFYVVADMSSRQGVWAARRDADGTWTRLQLHTGAIGTGIETVWDPVHQEPVVAFYSKADFGVKLRRLIDENDFSDVSAWTSEIVRDARYEEGDHLSLAISGAGDLALAYHRCALYNPDDESCDPNHEALVFARDSNGDWMMETVREEQWCGHYTGLDIAADGTVYIAFQCVEENSGDFSNALFVASKVVF